MPLPAWLARLNRRMTNHALRPAARTLPYFGVVLHHGRNSGRLYRTPVNAFPDGESFWIALTYGPEVDWARNVLAADGCGLVHRSRTIHLAHPQLLQLQEGPDALPAWVRAMLRTLGVRHFLRLQREGPGEHRDRS